MLFNKKHSTQLNYDELHQTDVLAAAVGAMMQDDDIVPDTSVAENVTNEPVKNGLSPDDNNKPKEAAFENTSINDDLIADDNKPKESTFESSVPNDSINADNKEPLISLRHISKIYKMGDEELRANDDISLDINRGEFVAIVGKSGSGKSTLMNIIGALDVPSEGSYLLDGRDISTMNDNELAEIRNHKLGFIFQQYNLLPKLSILENVELPLLYQGVKEPLRKDKAMAELERVGLKDKAYNRPKQLSGGQQQRVSIARALAGSPSIILADEPTGALDSKTGREVLGFLKQLNGEGNTIIMITHDPTLAVQAKRVVQIMDGRITFDGSAEEYGKL